MRSRKSFIRAALAATAVTLSASCAVAQWARPTQIDIGDGRGHRSPLIRVYNPGPPDTFQSDELVESGHRFFGTISRGLALAVQEATRRWGEPNGYILGQEASGAFFGGVRYGEGRLYTRNAGERRIFWQGPSLGFDVGGDGARTMMLVYNMPSVDALYKRFVGIDGSAYLIGGFGVTAAAADEMVVVPIRSGLGWRLGVNMGYLKFTPQPTWNPF